MQKLIQRQHGIFFVGGFALILAVSLRHIGFRVNEPFDLACSILRTLIYIGLFAAWGFSVNNRIIQPQVRHYLMIISVLMGFWLAVRGIRHSLDTRVWLIRHLWYLYYLPMLFIPLLSLFVAAALGKPDHFRLPGRMNLLYMPAAALLIFVLTNDRHQLVFRFQEDAVVWMNDYQYGIVYFLAFGWMAFCALAALMTMLVKCRVPCSRTVLTFPFIPTVAALLYGSLWIFRKLGIFRLAWLNVLAGDMTVVYCLLITAVLESCIQCGLIQANTGYEELFMAGRLGAQITDKENVTRMVSANALHLTEEQKKNARIHPVSLDKNTFVISHPIHFGHVLWQEDVTELSRAIGQTEENCRKLSERNSIRQKNLETRKHILALQEKNLAVDMLNRETSGQIRRIERLLAQYGAETDEGERKRLLAGAAVLGAYIKRCGNLLLVSRREETADIRDLARCFEDSFVNLELLDAKCLCTLPADVILATKDMLRVYHTFETVLEDCLFDVHSVWVNARERKGKFLVSIDFVCDTDLSGHKADADLYSCEDGTCRFTFQLRKGGDGV